MAKCPTAKTIAANLSAPEQVLLLKRETASRLKLPNQGGAVIEAMVSRS
jgi:hypothetical protein